MTDCFRCGLDDHLSYDCPNHTRRQPPPAPPHPSGQAAEPSPASKLPGYGVPVERLPAPDPEIARRWAQFIRQALGWQDITEDDELVVTEFRERYKMTTRHASQLRTMAAEQVAEARKDRWTDDFLGGAP